MSTRRVNYIATRDQHPDGGWASDVSTAPPIGGERPRDGSAAEKRVHRDACGGWAAGQAPGAVAGCHPDARVFAEQTYQRIPIG
jgi:hypothetical protein